MANFKSLDFLDYNIYKKYINNTCRIKSNFNKKKLIFQKNIKKNIKILKFLSLIAYVK